MNTDTKTQRQMVVASVLLPYIDVHERTEAKNHLARSAAWAKALEAAAEVLRRLEHP